jgi:hypothetical protein
MDCGTLLKEIGNKDKRLNVLLVRAFGTEIFPNETQLLLRLNTVAYSLEFLNTIINLENYVFTDNDDIITLPYYIYEKPCAIIYQMCHRFAQIEGPSELYSKIFQQNMNRACNIILDMWPKTFKNVKIIKNQTIIKIADSIYNYDEFECLPILADALGELNNNQKIIDDCRLQRKRHRGYWLVDHILEKRS